MTQKTEISNPPIGEVQTTSVSASQQQQPVGGLDTSKDKMKNQITEPISLDESKRLISLEKIIKEGVATFISVGDALAEIKDSRLYRADFPTFQAYCDKTWNFTRMRAYQLIEAAEVHKALPSNVKKSFTNPHQLNALAKLPKAKRVKAAKAIIKAVKKSGGRITAKVVRAEVSKQLPRGGLAAEAIRAQRGETKLDHLTKPKAISNPVIEQEASFDPITPKEFQSALDALESRIPADCDHRKFGTIANKLAERQMNWGKMSSTSAYT